MTYPKSYENYLIRGFYSTLKVSLIVSLLCSSLSGDVAHSKARLAKIHPVLSTERYEHFEATDISNDAARKLCHMLKKTDGIVPWSAAFEACESEAATLTCKKLIGKSTREVTSLLGTPVKHSIYPQSEQAANWLYIFGCTPILLRLEFVNEKCTSATFTTFYDDIYYCDWRSNSIMKSCVGNTVDTVIKREGWPFDGWRQTDFGKEDYQKAVNDLLKSKESLKKIDFRIYNWMISLRVKNCRVASVEKLISVGPKLLGESRKGKYAGFSFRYPE